jgi:hypothetical protein
MTMNLTRGGLTAGKIKNLSDNSEVKFMFNPYEYTIKKTNTWQEQAVMGENLPRIIFDKGGAQDLALKLHFDTLAQAQDVRGITKSLWKMMMIDTSSENTTTGKGSPPKVQFEWGGVVFKSVVISLSEKFTLFTANGTPVRCEIDISLRQVEDNSAAIAQIPAVTSASTSTVTSTSSLRMDMAALLAGAAGGARELAANNNVDDPLKVPNGTKLKS